MKRIRVLLVAPLPPPMGGIAAWTKRVLDYAPLSCEADICHVDSAVRNRRIDQIRVWDRIRAGLTQGPALLWDVFSALRRERPDLIHLTTSGGYGAVRDLGVLVIANMFRVPTTYHLRFGRLPEIAASRNWEWRLLHLNSYLASAIWVLDERSFAAFSEAWPTLQVRKVPNPVPSDLFARRPDNEAISQRFNLIANQYLLFAGRATEPKGIVDLLSAWASIAPSNWQLAVAGSCEAQWLEQLICERGVTGNTLLLGELEQPELMDVMAGCGIFVLPSHTEGFPNAILEAMTVGCAIVATDVGAVAEMLSDGAGCVVPAHDPSKLATVLNRLMAQPDARKVMGGRARLSVLERYTLPIVFSQYVELWVETSCRARPR